MSNDPQVRHWVCPTCHTHQPINPATGELELHFQPDQPVTCAGSQTLPPHAAYSPGSNFESCPAATGEALPPCTHFPDGAHRCGESRRHITENRNTMPADEFVHICTCGHQWTALTGTLRALHAMYEQTFKWRRQQPNYCPRCGGTGTPIDDRYGVCETCVPAMIREVM